MLSMSVQCAGAGASATDHDACIRLIFHCLAKLFLTDTRYAERKKCVKQVPRSIQPNQPTSNQERDQQEQMNEKKKR